GALGAGTYASALPLTSLAALLCWCYRAPRSALVMVLAGFLAGGAVLAAEARVRALHSSLRQTLDRAFGGFLIDSIGPAGRHDPTLSRGLLIEDASPRDGFVSLRAEIVAVQLHGAWERAEGGVAISINGAPGNRVTEWRAGRIIEAPMTFRRPARFLNDGVPDFERDQALDGVTLLGTIKSGLLIDVLRPAGFLAEQRVDWVARCGLRRHRLGCSDWRPHRLAR